MSKNYNGHKTELRERTASPESPVGLCESKKDLSKKFFETSFRGFVPVPHVRLERIDITPYLNQKRLPSKKKTTKIGGKKVDVHTKRLSQKCVVKLKRDDLEKLRREFLNSVAPSLGRPSTTRLQYDSDASNSTAMSVKCKICEKTYSSEKKLQNHQQNKHIILKTEDSKPQKRVSFSDHVIIHEVKEYHKCRKCHKIFEEYQLLRSHMKTEHKKRKCYICHYCSKKFVDRMFFKVHIRLHCDVCSKLFPNKTRYVEHRRNVCRVIKLHKCKTCNESYFKLLDLKDHSYDHEHNDAFYVCDLCKDHFSSKCGIAHHIAFLHSNKRPKELYIMCKVGTERLYLCNFCDESTVERNTIEKHVQQLPDLTNRAMTGFKDYYFCDQCLQKFDTEKEMLEHKWTHFLKSDENSILRGLLNKRQPKFKSTYNIKEGIPEHMKPVVLLSKIDDINPMQFMEFVDSSTYDTTKVLTPNDYLKKPVVDQKSKKTLLSKHQCQTCGRYFSTNYCLNRHISQMHADYENLRCKVCEETFVWPSLLKSHKCIRLNHPEMPFDDARPEIHFENIPHNGFDDLNIVESDDYSNRVDFEIPAPVVELRECDSTYNCNSVVQAEFISEKDGVSSSGYRVVMQEVPIEF